MADQTSVDAALVQSLVDRVIELYGPSPSDLERMCWMVVHEHHHQAMPTEYDIREVDENLYLVVLNATRQSL